MTDDEFAALRKALEVEADRIYPGELFRQWREVNKIMGLRWITDQYKKSRLVNY
jgi:hypothetical protein